uniref:Uncharacterized protein n=1 Tax=Populus trichocarpa TaxID=3694 RepID=B9MU99_POPTR
MRKYFPCLLIKVKRRLGVFQGSLSAGRETQCGDTLCNSVKHARGAHFDRLSKTGPKGAGSHANSGRNWQRRFMRLKMTQQEPAVEAAKWACRTWVVAVMDIQDHGIMGAEHGG